MSFSISCRDQPVRVEPTRTALRLHPAPGTAAPVRVGVDGQVHELTAGRIRQFRPGVRGG